jgi:hypothetical protein
MWDIAIRVVLQCFWRKYLIRILVLGRFMMLMGKRRLR